MNKAISAVTAAVLALAAGAGGYFYYRATPGHTDFPSNAALKGLDGAPHTIAEYPGKLLLVNFWATWCGPCLEEMPDLIKAQKKYGARGLQVVGIAVDDADAALKTKTDLGIDYPVLTGSPDDLGGLMRTLGNEAGVLPFSVWVDAKGQIIDHILGQIGMSDVDAMSKKYLSE